LRSPSSKTAEIFSPRFTLKLWLEISGKGYERMRGASVSVKPTLIKHLSASAAAKRIGSNVD